MATGFEDLGAIEEPKSQPHGFEDLGAVAEKTRSSLSAYPAPAAQDDTAAFADLGAVTPKVRAQQLVADPEFNPAAYAHETGDEDTAFEARELRRNRSFGEKAAEFGGTLLKPETYGHAARSVAAFAGGLVATPLHAIAQAGATAGAPIARAVGADDLANTLENEQQTLGSEALQSAQQIEESLRSLGRGARGLVSGDERARFRDEIAAYRNQLALGKQRPLDTGVVAAASRMLTGNDPSAAFSPEALAAQGARPASPLMIELGAASADPTNLMIPVAGKALPKVLAGGITQAAGKALQAPAAAIAYIPKVAHLNKVMKTGSAIGAGVAAYEAIQHPEQAAQIAGVIALGKTLGWLGKGLDAQGLAYRTGTPSPLDIAKAAGRGTMSGNAQRLIGNTAVNAALGVAALEPVDYLQAEGDPRRMAEAFIGNAGMGAMFGLPGETFANRQQMQAIQAYRFAQHGAQQLSQNAAYPAHNAVMAKFGKPYQDAINRLRAYLHAGTGTDVLVLDGQSYAQQVGAIGQNTRGNFAAADGVIYLNADSISADPLRTGRHEAGHAIVNFLQNAGRDGEASGLFDAIKAGMTPEQLTTLTSSYRSALSKGTKVAAEQSGLGWEKGEDAAARARVDAAIAEANPEVKILEENLSEIVRDILDGRGVESFSLSKPILERLTDSVAGWMERRGWLNPIDTKAKLGFKAQAVKEAARQAKTLLYETGQRASQAIADGPTAEQEMIRIQREIDAVPPFNPQGVAATEQANAQQRQRLQRELSQWERRGAGIPVPEDAAPPSPDGTPAPAPAADPITTAAEQLRAEGNRTPYPAVRQAMQRNPAATTAEQIVETVKALAVEKQAVKDAITLLTTPAYKFTPAEAKQWTDAVIAAHGDPVTDAQKLTLAAARMKRGGQVRPGEFNQQGKPSVPKNIPPFNGPADADGNQATHTVIGESDQPPAWGEYVLTQDGKILRLVKPTVDGKGWSAAAPFGSDSTAGHTVLNDTFTVLETSASPTVRPPSPAQGSTPPTPAPAQAATPAPAAGDLSPSEPTPPGYVTKEGDISTFIRTDGTKVQMAFKNGEWVDLSPQSQKTPSGTPQGAPAAILGLDPAPGAETPEPPEPPAPKPKGAPIPLAKGPGGVDDVLNLIAKMGGIVSRKGTQEFDDMSKRLAGYPIMGGTETPEDLANNLHVNHNIGDGSVVEMWKAIDAAIVGRKNNRLQETQENARQRQAEREHEAQMAKLPADLQEKITRPGGAEMTPAEIAQVQAVFPDFEYQPPENAPEPPTGPAPQPPTGEPVPPRTGVAVAVPVEAPDRNQSTPIRLDEIEQVAASAKAEAVAAEKPKKDGTYFPAAQDRIRKAELMAVIRAHSDRMPLNHEGIRLRTDPFGRETVSGKLDESADFDNWLLNQSSLAGKWDAIGNLLTLQNSLGKTLQIDYGHAPTGEGATTADARRAGIAKATAEDRARGEAPMEVQRKTIVPLEIQYNPGTESFTVLGASPEKLLSNWTHLQEAYGILEEPMPYRDIHDPRLVADMKGYVRNHQNNRQGDGSTMKGKQGERIDPTGPAYPIAEAQFEFLNALMGDESAKSETKQGEAKASLAQFNDRMVNAQAGETNPLRERINAKMREKFGEWPVTDENGNPVPGKFTTWTKGNIENPLSEALRPDLIQAIHQETTRDDASIRPAGYKGDVGRFLGAGIPERGRVAAGFMPEEGSAALIDTKKLDKQIRAASGAKKSAKLAAIIRQIIRDAREQGDTIPTSPNHEQAWAMAKIVNSFKPEYGDAFAEAGRLLRDAGLTNENRSLKELHGQEGYFLNSFGEDFLAGRFDEPIKRGVPNIGVRAQRGFLGRPVPITLPDYDGNKLPSFLPEEAGAENASEAIKARAAKLWKEKGAESPFFKKWSGNLPESTTAKPLPRTGAVIRAFHGTPDASFSVFNENSHFTENEKYADRYQGESASSINVRAKEAKNPKTIAVFIKTEKPFDTRNPQERRVYEREFLNKYGNGTPLSKRGLPDWTDSRDMLEWLDEKGLDYDSVILDEGGTPEGGWRGTAIVPRKPTQIKSTTGNQGTFDPASPDIRFLPEDDSPKAKAKTRQRDREYMKAVEAGDTETAQRMVDEAAKKAGYDLSGIREAAGLYKYYSDKARKTERSEDYDALENFGYKYNEQAVKAGLSESASSQMLSDVGTGMSESDAIRDAIATTQIKSADPITYNDQGNVIPLSERFNPTTGDIRFMPEDPRDRVRERQDDRRRAEDQLRRRLGSAYGSLTPREREQEVAALLRRPERGARFMPEDRVDDIRKKAMERWKENYGDDDILNAPAWWIDRHGNLIPVVEEHAEISGDDNVDGVPMGYASGMIRVSTDMRLGGKGKDIWVDSNRKPLTPAQQKAIKRLAESTGGTISREGDIRSRYFMPEELASETPTPSEQAMFDHEKAMQAKYGGSWMSSVNPKEAAQYRRLVKAVNSPKKWTPEKGGRLYHGTMAEDFQDFDNGEVYLATDPNETRLYAAGMMGTNLRSRTGQPRIIATSAKPGRIKDINTAINDALENGDIGETLKEEAAKARKEGYRYLTHSHPGHASEEFDAIISLYPRQDVKIHDERPMRDLNEKVPRFMPEEGIGGYADPVFDIPQEAQAKIYDQTEAAMAKNYPGLYRQYRDEIGDVKDEYQRVFQGIQSDLSNRWARENPRTTAARRGVLDPEYTVRQIDAKMAGKLDSEEGAWWLFDRHGGEIVQVGQPGDTNQEAINSAIEQAKEIGEMKIGTFDAGSANPAPGEYQAVPARVGNMWNVASPDGTFHSTHDTEGQARRQARTLNESRQQEAAPAPGELPQGYRIQILSKAEPGVLARWTLIGPDGTGRAFTAGDRADAMQQARSLLPENLAYPSAAAPRAAETPTYRVREKTEDDADRHSRYVIEREHNGSREIYTSYENRAEAESQADELQRGAWTESPSAQPRAAATAAPQQPMTVREMRTALFNMPTTQATSALRQQLFDLENQDDQASAWAMERFAAINSQTAEAGRQTPAPIVPGDIEFGQFRLQQVSGLGWVLRDSQNQILGNFPTRSAAESHAGRLDDRERGVPTPRMTEAQTNAQWEQVIDTARRELGPRDGLDQSIRTAWGTINNEVVPDYDSHGKLGQIIREAHEGTIEAVQDRIARIDAIERRSGTTNDIQIERARLGDIRNRLEAQARSSMPRLPQPRGELSDRSPLASLHTDLDGKIVEQQASIVEEIKALTEQIDADDAASVEDVRAKAELEEFRRSLVEDHAGLNSLRESLRLANPTTFTEYPRAFAEIRRLEVRGLISHEAKERAYDALSDRQNTEIARQIIAEEEARPERERQGRIDAKIRVAQREAAKERTVQETLWDEMLRAKEQRAIPKIVRLLRQISRNDEAFQYTTSKAKDPVQIAADISTPNSPITVSVSRYGDTITWRSKNGAISIYRADTDRPEIGAPGAGSQGKKEGGGAQMYKASLDWAINNGKQIQPSNALSEINAYVRRTAAMESSAIQHNTTAHMIPDDGGGHGGRSQGVRNWIDTSKMPEGKEKRAADANNIAQLSLRASEQVMKAVPELQPLDFDFKTGKIKDSRTGNEITPADITKILETKGKKLTYERGIGVSTAQRAILIASAIREAEGGALARPDRGRGVRVLKEQGKMFYMPEDTDVPSRVKSGSARRWKATYGDEPITEAPGWWLDRHGNLYPITEEHNEIAEDLPKSEGRYDGLREGFKAGMVRVSTDLRMDGDGKDVYWDNQRKPLNETQRKALRRLAQDKGGELISDHDTRSLFYMPEDAAVMDRIQKDFRRWEFNYGRHWKAQTMEEAAEFLGRSEEQMAALNAYMSGGFTEMSQNPDHPVTQALVKLLKRMPSVQVPEIYRALGFMTPEDRDAYLQKIGAEGATAKQERAITSWTTHDPKGVSFPKEDSIALEMADMGGPHTVILTVKNPTNAKDISFGYSPGTLGGMIGTNEVLLPPGTKMKVESIRRQGDQVHVEMVPSRARETGSFMPEDTGKPGESGRREENLAREAEAAGINLSLETLKRLTRGDHEAMPGRFGDKRSPDDRAIERWQDGLGTDWKTPSVFFGPDGSGYTDYGPDRVPAAIHKNARLFKGRSSMDFAYKRGLMKQRRPEVEELTGKWTLEEVADHLGDYMELKGRTDTSNPDYAAFQEVAKRELENEGYDGAHWSYEDELSPEQYQIWNKDVIRFMPESLPDDRQRVKQHAVEVAMREIEQDMKDGTVPRTATSFGELQEHTDANLYVNDAEREDRRIGPLGKSLGWKPQDYADFTNELIAEIDKRLSTRQRERQHSVHVGDARMTPGAQNIQMPRFLPEELHHGTPHEVDRFTTKKIGTGEGAQAYGWGLYFAQSRAVAKDYAKKLGGEYTVALNADGSPINTEGMSDAAKKLIREATNTIMVKGRSNRESLKVWHESLTDQKETALRWARQGENPESNRAYAKAVDEVLAATKNAKLEHRLAGNLYTVRVKPDADAFLDWDKPLSEQSPKVRKALQKSGVHLEAKAIGETPTGEEIYRRMVAHAAKDIPIERSAELVKNGGHPSRDPKAASEKLASLGIAGIRYLDQGSRNQGPWTVVFKDGRKIELGTSEAGKNLADAARQEGTLREFIEPPKPTSNYAIFNEADIEITHRNGEPVTPAERREAMGEQKFMPEDESITDEQKDVIKSFIRANNDYDKDPTGVNEDGENIYAYYENELARLGEAGLTEHQVNGIMGAKTVEDAIRSAERRAREAMQNPAPGEQRFMPEDDQRAYEKAGVEVLRDQDTGGKYRVAVKLDDGTVLIPTRKPFWSAHIDAAASLPSEILDRVVDGGFVKDGKWEPGGDLHQGLEKNENVHDYYGIPRDGAGFMPEDEPSIASLRDEFKRTSLISTGTAKRIMGDKPDYLDAVVDFMAKQRAKTVAGKLTKRDVAKAYLLTLSSIGAGGISPETFTAKTGMKVPSRYLSVEGGKQRIRPEEAAALWMGTKDGKAALDAIEAGNATPDMLESLLTMRDAFGRNDIRNNALRVGGRQRTLANIAEVADEINAAKGNVEQIGKALTSLTGIAGGKIGFIKHLLGLGDTSTVDAVELNFWLTGKGSTRQQDGTRQELVRNLKERGLKNPSISKLVTDRIGQQVARLARQYDLDPEVASHIIHHWLWDTAKDATTTHKGMMEAQARYMPEESAPQPPERPARGAKLPDVMAYGRDRRAWIDRFVAWSEKQPRNKPIVLADGDDRTGVITPAIGGGYRITRYLDIDGEQVPHGHQEFKTREEAVKDALTSDGFKGASDRRFMPESAPEAPRQRPDPRSAARQRIDQRGAGFANWTKGTKVVEIPEQHEFKTGEPVTVIGHHGSAVPITAFDVNKAQGVADPQERGIYFLTTKEMPERYAKMASQMGRGKEPTVTSAYLRMENPFVGPRKSFKQLRAEGYDAWIGVPRKDSADKGVEIAVFNGNQIKSSTDNSGAFDPKNPDIRFMPEAEDIERANRTARAAGAVGSKAITPRYVAETLKPGETVLNFGAGKPDASGKYGHSETIRAAGGLVTEHDFGRNAATAAKDALAKKYDTVFASNVLNVQSGIKMLTETLEQIKSSAKKRAVFNFPESPRYSDLTAEDVAAAIKNTFGSAPKKVGGTNRAPLWEVEITATAPRNAPNAKEAARRRMAARTQPQAQKRELAPAN